MDPRWSHYPSIDDTVKPLPRKSPEERSSRIRSRSLAFAPPLPPASRAVGAPISISAQDNIFRGSQGMGPLSTTQEMNCHSSAEPQGDYSAESTEAPVLRRNLTEAFEEMVRIEPATDGAARTPATKQQDVNSDGDATKDLSEVSPTGVADLNDAPPVSNASTVGSETSARNGMEANSETPVTTPKVDDEGFLPTFTLHNELKRDLSQALVNRVSFYCVIRDINQEAVSMASNDNSSFARSEAAEDEEMSPLVIAVNGAPSKAMDKPETGGSMVDSALIDEEKWLLAAIESRGNEEEPRVIHACPPTFSQAMGEREYENPLASLATSRTQLWKPSRSWWEAKSGKNPWIEPKSHNKRWRYLWPLIHYHKFLARCIKKLKRNGVDVKSSVSPVAVFLREEVCAVSDHLAAVSLFTSEEWMAVLVHFNGWNDPDPRAEARLRTLVSKQKLRPMSDQCDVDSPLLRSQIDEQFLKAMASAREQMENGAKIHDRKSSRKDSSQAAQGNSSNRKNGASVASQATPPLPQYISAASPADGTGQRRKGGKAGQQHPPGYPNHTGNWHGNGWLRPPQYGYGDDTSAHSGSFSTMSIDGHPPNFGGNAEYGGMYHGTPSYYPTPHQQYASASPGHHPPECYFYPQSAGYDRYPAEHGMADGTYPNMTAYGFQPHPDGTPHYGYHGSASPAEVPPSPYHYSPAHAANMDSQYVHQNDTSTDQTPYKYPPNGVPRVPQSPYWGHIDPLSMVFSPQGKPSPVTPQRSVAQKTEEQGSEGSLNPPQYYSYGPHGVPPSPATQFMMTQENAYFARNYANGSARNSPPRPARSMRNTLTKVESNVSESNEQETPANNEEVKSHVTPPPAVRKVTNNGDDSTVQTAAETESIH